MGNEEMADAEQAADVRMLFEVNIADIRECKALEWNVTYQVFLLFGVIIALDGLIDTLGCFLSVAALTVGVSAGFILWGIHCTIANRRTKLDELEKHLKDPTRDPSKSVELRHGAWIPIGLILVVVLGAAATAQIVLPSGAPPG